MTTSDFFDDLSRSWQQQVPTPPSTAGKWEALRARGSRSPIARMARQVWAELVLGTLVAVPLVAGLLRMSGDLAHGAAAVLTGLSALSLVYYYSQLRVLRQLQRTADPVRRHAAGLLRQMRGLLRLGYYANLGLTAMVAALAFCGVMYYMLPTLPTASASSFLVWFGLTVVASLALVHWLTKLHIRESYGQHLDRLEAVLRDLNAE